MKPTQEQQSQLKTYLWNNLRYNETYAEVYDHVLTALESQPDYISFQDTIDSIINNDFGGFNGLAMIEARYRWAATREIKNRYLVYLTECLKLPFMGVLIISLVAIYYMVCRPWFSYYLFCDVIISIGGIQAILFNIRYIRTGYTWGSTKRSVKDRGFLWLRYIPFGILSCVFLGLPCLFIKDINPSHWFKNASPVVIAVMLIAFMVHTLATYRVYRHDFKVSLPKK